MESVEERHRHRYEVNPKYVEEIEKAGLKFVGHSTDNTRMEIVELPGMAMEGVEVGKSLFIVVCVYA